RAAWPSAVLFDLDGTLVDSFLGIAATVDAVLVGRGAAPCDRATLRGMIGAPLEVIFAALVPGLPPEGAGEHVAEYLRRFPDLGVPASPLFAGILPALDACRAAGLRLAVVTTKRTRVARSQGAAPRPTSTASTVAAIPRNESTSVPSRSNRTADGHAARSAGWGVRFPARSSPCGARGGGPRRRPRPG
ncbi:MAG TPA: HAD hydrolase-like protein, partial [Chloroflexota bacterium]|nr:HAD hydrolase-like protein [Chloroflexota bacterium]